MAQQSRILDALVEDTGLNSSTHMVTHTYLKLQLQMVQHHLLVSSGTMHP